MSERPEDINREEVTLTQKNVRALAGRLKTLLTGKKLHIETSLTSPEHGLFGDIVYKNHELREIDYLRHGKFADLFVEIKGLPSPIVVVSGENVIFEDVLNGGERIVTFTHTVPFSNTIYTHKIFYPKD